LDESWSNRVVIVTGASRGIGYATASRFAMAGASVVIASRRKEAIEAVAVELSSKYSSVVLGLAVHSGKPDDLESAVDEIVERFGRIDVLVNNAAASEHYGPLVDAELSAWDKTYDVNVRGTFVITRAVVNRGMTSDGGAIVNVASVGADSPVKNLGDCDTTNAAVVQMTKHLAQELGPRGIRVNAVAPGLIETKLAEVLWGNPQLREQFEFENPLGRIGMPEEVASAICFLSSCEASYINGQVLFVDGGSARVA
jgi:NAD(P)-dependent dehydrogenase (short-subunit alcohol dehydrogenase family)